jgi:hypothetical protein
LKKISGSEFQGAWRQDELIDGKPPVMKQLWTVTLSQSRAAVAEAQWEFRNPEESKLPPLEAASEQRLGKTEKALCVL